MKECGGAKAELHENDDTWEVKEAERGWTWAPCVDLGRLMFLTYKGNRMDLAEIKADTAGQLASLFLPN